MFLKKKDETFERYRDPTGELTNRTLSVATWYVRHKVLLQQIGFWALVVWCVITIGYSLIVWGNYAIFGYVADQRALSQQLGTFQNYADQHARSGAAPFQITDIRAVQSGPGRYDFIAMVGNPNSRWVAEMTYQFRYSGGVTQTQKTTMLPQSQRPVVSFGQEMTQFPVGIQFEIVDVTWRHVDAHVVPDMSAYAAERLLFETANITITPARTVGDLPLHRIEFDLTNASAYAYAEPEFYVLLRNGTLLSGVVPLTMNSLQAGETIRVDLRTGIEPFSTTGIDIVPIMNIFSSRSFISPKS